MITPHFEIDPFTAVGLGWFIHEDDESHYIFHMGGDVGFSAMMTFFPKHQLSIVVLSNCDFTDVRHATSAAFRVLQQKHPYQILTTYCLFDDERTRLFNY